MKTSITFKSLLALLALTLGLCFGCNATAQTSPSLDAINSVAVDTNSAFFASQQFDIRSGYNSANTQADLGVDYNVAAHWQFGSDFGFSTGANTLSTAQANGMYRIPVHNMEFDGGLCGGYNWDNSKAYIGAVGRFSYVVSPSVGITAFVQPQVTEVFVRDNKPTIGVILGVGKSF